MLFFSNLLHFFPFPNDFITRDDTLILIPATDLVYPQIRLRSDPNYGIGHAGIREIKDMIELIQLQDITHVFYSSDYENGRRPEILTFSLQVPPKEFYKLGAIMPVEIDNTSNEIIAKILKRD